MSPRTSRPARAFLVSRLAILTLAGIALTQRPAPAADGPTIPWRASFETARQEALARDRPLWVQFTGAWCPYCRLIERETFTRAEVIALSLDDFVPVQVSSDQREDLVVHYQVVSLPATLLLAPDGRVLARREGYLKPPVFLALMDAGRLAFQQSRPTPAEPEIALAGYDPVRLVEGNGLAAGHPRLSVRVEGREYRFTDDAQRSAFLRAPERFLPCGNGRCMVTLVEQKKSVAGDPRHGVYYRDHLYLCASESAREQFVKDPERYASADLAEEGRCPHCPELAGRRVPGRPEFSWFYRGRRYLFPDATHRTAFQSAPEQYIR